MKSKIYKSAITFALLVLSGVFNFTQAQNSTNFSCSEAAKSCSGLGLGLFAKSSNFYTEQTKSVIFCKDSQIILDAFTQPDNGLTAPLEAQENFTYASEILTEAKKDCKKSKYEDSAQLFEDLYDELEDEAISSIRTLQSEGKMDASRKLVEILTGENSELRKYQKNRIAAQIDVGNFTDVPSSKNIFGGGDGKILGYKSKLKDYTGNAEDGNSQLRSVLLKLFEGLKRLLIPISIFLIVLSGAMLFIVQRGDVPEEIPKKRNQVFNILIGWTVFSFAFSLVDFVIFGNKKDGFILRDDYSNVTDNYAINSDRSMEFARRILGETEGIVEMMLTFFVIISVLFLIISTIRLIFAADEENYEATKSQVLHSIIAVVVSVSLKPLLALFYQNGDIVRPSATTLIEFFAKWSDYLLGFIGTAATLSLVYGGIRLIIDYGNGEAMDEAKKIIMYSALGIVLAFSAWTIVNFFSSPADGIAMIENTILSFS